MHFTAIVTAAAFATMAAASPASRRAESKSEKPECFYNSKQVDVKIDRTKATFTYEYHHNDDDKTDACVFYDDGDNQQKHEFELLDCSEDEPKKGVDHVTFEIPTLGDDDDTLKSEAILINQKAMSLFQEKTDCVMDPEFEV